MGFSLEYGHNEWENKKGKKLSVRFSNPATNVIIYCSYRMTNSEKSTEEE